MYIEDKYSINHKYNADALNDLLIKISGDLEKSFSWEIDLLPMRFQLVGKKITRYLYESNTKLPYKAEKLIKIV